MHKISVSATNLNTSSCDIDEQDPLKNNTVCESEKARKKLDFDKTSTSLKHHAKKENSNSTENGQKSHDKTDQIKILSKPNKPYQLKEKEIQNIIATEKANETNEIIKAKLRKPVELKSSDGKCFNCENVAKQIIYLENFIKYGKTNCSMCLTTLKFIDYLKIYLPPVNRLPTTAASDTSIEIDKKTINYKNNHKVNTAKSKPMFYSNKHAGKEKIDYYPHEELLNTDKLRKNGLFCTPIKKRVIRNQKQPSRYPDKLSLVHCHSEITEKLTDHPIVKKSSSELLEGFKIESNSHTLYSCKYCGLVFCRSHLLRVHILQVHRKSEPSFEIRKSKKSL